MTLEEQRRTLVVTKVAGGGLAVAEAAAPMGRPERQLWRLRAACEREGAAGVVHGNRGRASPRRPAQDRRARILDLVAGRYAGVNDTHLAELPAEREGITIGRSSLQRLPRSASRPSPHRRRPPRQRSRRERMPAAGLLLQIDGSRHDWLDGRCHVPAMPIDQTFRLDTHAEAGCRVVRSRSALPASRR